ncbi:hypothetical protein [Facklamia miroungae]|uniref:Uncharacterized protein n=1 Tax=Facklamia miroungae TaxID=120956 RepID=A0A1G7SHQ2_9LACT|nr:hypothetical protein [Facklamia miroungae]NKZ29649.1 hypothetical protein [Facklamia miroungae]SDG22523.1 hypothetical protein SAMN05421791_10428 [Facklamia miroungae]
MRLNKFKSLFVFILIGLLFMPKAIAQGSQSTSDAWSEIAKKVGEQSFQSFHMEGKIGVKISSQGMTSDFGNVDLDLQMNDQPIALQVVANVVSPFLGSEPIGFESYSKDGFTYVYSTYSKSWEVTEWSVTEEDILKSIQDSFEKSANDLAQSDWTHENERFINNYFEFEEKNKDYLFKLKKNIDGEAFYHDLDEAIDLKKVINESADKAKDQSEELGQSFDQDYEKSIEKVLNPDTFKTFFEMNPEMIVTYGSQTGQLKNIVLKIDVNSDVLSKTISQEDQANLPQKISVDINLNFDQYGERINIQIPTEAVQYFQESSTEE